ncbi:hypothetical protein BDR07DRAFT_1380215 [Suillus spraguei]|nr:hypothetical protein BDR07DRAFT_1380215 [Suillus spraguei]
MAPAFPRGSTDRRHTCPSFDPHYAETHSSTNLTSHGDGDAVRTFPGVVRIFVRNVQASSKISFQVFATRYTCEHDYIGMVEESVETLLDHHSRTLLVPGTTTKMEFKITPSYGSIPPNPLLGLWQAKYKWCFDDLD